jgi:hypothetical protein
MATNVAIRCGEKKKNFMLYPGMPIEELTVFFLPSCLVCKLFTNGRGKVFNKASFIYLRAFSEQPSN